MSGEMQPKLMDYICYPWVERLVFLEQSMWGDRIKDLDLKNKAPCLYKYFKTFRTHPVMKEHLLHQKAFNKSIEDFDRTLPGFKPAFKIGYLKGIPGYF